MVTQDRDLVIKAAGTSDPAIPRLSADNGWKRSNDFPLFKVSIREDPCPA